MTDMLTRQRLHGNLLDQLGQAQRQLGQLERSAAVPTEEGLLQLPGVLLQVIDAPPAPPPTGYVLLYAEKSGTTTYLRAMDEAQTVMTLDSWE